MAVELKISLDVSREEESPIFRGNLVQYCGANKTAVYVVMVASTESSYDDECFSGVVVYSKYLHCNVGEYDNSFVIADFKQFEGTISLTGSK